MEPKAKTPEEVRDELLRHFAGLVDYWDRPELLRSQKQRLSGLVFSILPTLDGSAISFPAFDLVPSPHEDDKEYLASEGLDWFEPVSINEDCHLHELWYKYCKH